MVDRKMYVLGAAAIVGVLIVYTEANQIKSTTGDNNSNIFMDAFDKAASLITGWPNGSGPYQDIINSAATSNGIPPLVLAWLLWKESRYNPDIINGSITSPVGALGIAQFMPATAQETLGSTAAALDPAQAIPGAARYLGGLYANFGQWNLALAAYNWGEGNVQRKGLAAAPPETVDYYTTIMKYAGVA